MEVKETINPITITIVGSSNVGKASIIKRYIENKFDELSTTDTIIAECNPKK